MQNQGGAKKKRKKKLERFWRGKGVERWCCGLKSAWIAFISPLRFSTQLSPPRLLFFFFFLTHFTFPTEGQSRLRWEVCRKVHFSSHKAAFPNDVDRRRTNNSLGWFYWGTFGLLKFRVTCDIFHFLLRTWCVLRSDINCRLFTSWMGLCLLWLRWKWTSGSSRITCCCLKSLFFLLPANR